MTATDAGSHARPLAVVTGASSGIGFHLAGEFARNGFDVLAIAEDDELTTAVEQLRSHGTLVEQDPADQLEIVDLNVRSTVQLARLVIPDMARRGEGRILFTSAIASTQPGALHPRRAEGEGAPRDGQAPLGRLTAAGRRAP